MKILMINSFPDGGVNNYFENLYKFYNKSHEVTFIDIKKNKFLRKNNFLKYFIRYILYTFISLLYQLFNNYDLVITNQIIVIPIGKNLNCKYKSTLYHLAKNQKTNSIIFFLLNKYEKLRFLLSKNILTLSNFSKNEIEKEYPKSIVELLPPLIDGVFVVNKNKKHLKTKNIFLPNLYRGDSKGGEFITPILIKLAPILKEKKINLLISNCIFSSQKKNYKELNNFCNIKLLGNLNYVKLVELYSCSLIVLTPSTFEGYGLVPLEVIASGGKCISAPFPSLGFDNVSVNNPKRKVIIDGITVLEHDAELWEKEILKIIKKVK